MDIIMAVFKVLQICCRPTVTQVNMEFSNEN